MEMKHWNFSAPARPFSFPAWRDKTHENVHEERSCCLSISSLGSSQKFNFNVSVLLKEKKK